MNCDDGFTLVVLLLVLSMTGNIYCFLRWVGRKVSDALAAAEEVERGS